MLPSPSTTRTQEYPAVAPLKEFVLGSGLSWDLRKDGHPPKGQVVTEDWCSRCVALVEPYRFKTSPLMQSLRYAMNFVAEIVSQYLALGLSGKNILSGWADNLRPCALVRELNLGST